MISEELRKIYRDSLPAFSEYCLSIRTKSGAIKPFKFNSAQVLIHKKLEQQRISTGKVRAVIVKGRQQGCSTYIGARYYHKCINHEGVGVYIMTHLQEATDNLFAMVSQFHESVPDPLRPKATSDNAKELAFQGLRSGYKVGTAGSKSVGRGATIQLFHGSESAYWGNADEHLAGILQAVPNEAGTEIIFESTANGIGNMFHRLAEGAMRGENEYQLIFVPWFLQTEYQEEPKDLRLSDDDKMYQENYRLSDAQMMWRKRKIQELGSIYRFQREYPANPSEAFQISSEDSFISAADVLRARKAKTLPDVPYKCIMGVDPARYGEDDTAIVVRRGRQMIGAEFYSKKSTMEVAGIVAHAISRYAPDAVAIDVGGLGAGVYDRLQELGYENVYAVNFGSSAIEDAKYYNRRAEIWALMKEWLCDEPCKILDNDRLHGELIAPLYSYDSNGRLKIEKKEEMKKRGIKSPDIADALALTFSINMRELLSESEMHQEYSNYLRQSDTSRDGISGY